MSTYVMSDLHGCYLEYIEMLKQINFSEDDFLYILGDILDRGPDPIKIILDLMERPNVEVIAGNHCVMACECLPILLQDITNMSLSKMNNDMVDKLITWQVNGSKSTLDELHKCDKNMQREILDFIEDFELYAEVKVNGKCFVMVHAGLGNFDKNRELWDYKLNELVWKRPDYGKMYFKDKYLVTGHTPTQVIPENPRPGYIYQANNNIAIDCGCCFDDGRLACLRLDDMKEFYVEAKGVLV